MSRNCSCLEPFWLRVLERALWKAFIFYIDVLLMAVAVVDGNILAGAAVVVLTALTFLDLIMTPVRGCCRGT